MYDRRQFLGAIGRPATAAFTNAVQNTGGVAKALETLTHY